MNARHMAARLSLAACLACAGCAPAIVRSGLPAGHAPSGYDARWHHGLLFGLVDPRGAYDLRSICPQGWSEMRLQTPVSAGLLQVVTVGLYSPSIVTIVCAAMPGDPIENPGEESLP